MNKSIKFVIAGVFVLSAALVFGVKLPTPTAPVKMPVTKPVPARQEVLALTVEEPDAPRTGVVGPRWTYGIMVKNSSEKDITAWADGSPDKVAILAGTEKLLTTSSRGPKGVYWQVLGEVHETAKFVRPDFVEVKKGNVYDITAMDGVKDMGGWMGSVAVTVKDLAPQTNGMEAGL